MDVGNTPEDAQMGEEIVSLIVDETVALGDSDAATEPVVGGKGAPGEGEVLGGEFAEVFAGVVFTREDAGFELKLGHGDDLVWSLLKRCALRRRLMRDAAQGGGAGKHRRPQVVGQIDEPGED